jgi:putative transposase
MDGHRKRCERWNEAGHAHALTFSCFRRQPFLSKDRSRQWMVDAIDRARDTHRFHLWAYVIMPEHVHLLVCPTEADYSISAILKTMKQSVSRRAIEYLKQAAPEFLAQLEDRQPNGSISYRFWQRGGGYDRNLTEPAAIWATMDYIHANPVRRGLCQYAMDWIWSSYLEWERPESGLLRVDRESVPRTDAG